MVIGTVRLHSEDFIGAEREFVAADQEHQKKHGRQSHVALDSIGYVAFQCRWRGFNNSEPASVDDQLTKAMKYFEKALKVRPHYDSANYHLAQVEDERSRIVFRDMSTTNACAGLEHLTQAAGYYERLLQRNPNFAIAYEQYGTMLLQQYYFIRKNGSARCASDASLSSEGTQALFQKALDLFDKALALDPQLGQAW